MKQLFQNMVKSLFTIILLLLSILLQAQNQSMRTLDQLINTEDDGWIFVLDWKKEAKNFIEILPIKSKESAENELLNSQVTTRSPMGAIIYHSGGILIDGGWIRILGSGNTDLRGMMEWNLGKTYQKQGQQLPYLLIADDIIGGFFALNSGGLSKDGIGKVFYFAPDTLEWEEVSGFGYSDFIHFCFTEDLNKFYKELRWKTWKDDIKNASGNKAFSFIPFLFTKEGNDIEKVSKKLVSISEIWDIYNGDKK